MSLFRDKMIVVALPYISVLAAILMVWMSWSALEPFLSGLSRRQRLISLMLRDVIGMPASIALLCIALLTFPPMSVRFYARRTAGTERWFSPGPMLVWIAIISIVAVVITLPIASLVSNAVATGHGYEKCGAPRKWDPHPPTRWVLPGTPCP